MLTFTRNGTFTAGYLTKKTKVNEGEIPQYYVEGDHEAIIDPSVFDRVQIELEKLCSGKNRHSGVHDFSGKIKCGHCGSWYGMVEFVTVYMKDDILFTMKDGTEIRVLFNTKSKLPTFGFYADGRELFICTNGNLLAFTVL